MKFRVFNPLEPANLNFVWIWHDAEVLWTRFTSELLAFLKAHFVSLRARQHLSFRTFVWLAIFGFETSSISLGI
jgi:hypothetical protein